MMGRGSSPMMGSLFLNFSIVCLHDEVHCFQFRYLNGEREEEGERDGCAWGGGLGFRVSFFS